MLSVNLWSRDIYWVNDSGDFNDPNHWSLSSGGGTSDIYPAAEDRLFFDQNSFSDNNQVVQLNDSVNVQSINALYSEFKFNASENSALVIHDILKLNPSINGDFKGQVYLGLDVVEDVKLNTFGSIYFSKGHQIIYRGNDELLANNAQGNIQLLITDVTISISNPISCGGGSDGELTATVTGGTGNYSYTWFDSEGTFYPDAATITGLSDGTYTVIVADLTSGLVDNDVLSLTDPAGISILIQADAVTDASCFGICDGEIDIFAVSGGTGTLNPSWSNGETTLDITGLCAGAYTLTVTDDNGCSNTAVRTVDQPVALTVNTSSTNILCNGDANGTATATPAGGTTPYTYLWDDPGAQTSATATGLDVGTYNVTVTDFNGCTVGGSENITQPNVLAVTASGTNITCNGDGDGTATSNVTGGTTPYTYLWDDVGASTTPSINTLGQATYTVTVTDFNGCTANDSYTVTEPAVLSVVTGKTDLVCFGVCNGDATATPAGGTSPYTYVWDDPGAQSGGGVSHTATGLCAGLVNVTVTDDNGCTVGGSETLTESTEIGISIDAVTDITCNGGSDGDITSSAVGGTLPYASTIWDDPGSQNTFTPSGLSAGTYTITVTDNAGCVATEDTTLVEPDAVAGVVTANNTSCNGVCDGDLTVVASGGSGVYVSYLWDDPGAQTTAATTSTLCAGNFNVTITDDQGCTGIVPGTVTEPDAVSVTATETDVTCKSLDNGSISTVVVGGTAPYSYLWDDVGASTSSGISSLAPGTYSVVVTDFNGCTGTDNATIAEPDTLAYTFDAITNTTCNGDSDGDISGTTSGGTGPYVYSWTNGAPAVEDPTGLSANTYLVTVTDFNGCIITGDTTITEPDAIVIAEDLVTDATCNLGTDGAVDVSITGGTGPYTYLWDDPGATTSQDLSGVAAGTYNVVVTDFNLCTNNSNHTVGEPTAVTGVVTPVDASCNGVCDGEVLVTPAGGDGGPYTYLWDDPGASTGISVNGLCAATYNVVITDGVGCTGNASGDVDEPAANSVTVVFTPGTCAGACDGTATATPVGGTAPYSYLWDDPAAQSGVGATHTATGLCVGLINVAVTDANGCISNGNATVTAPTTVTASIISSSNVTCPGGSDGSAEVAGAGGVAPYDYDWTPISLNNAVHSTLDAGTHGGIIIDANGCRDTAFVVITQPDPIVITTTTIDPLCNAGTDGLAAVTNVTGGTGPYTYLWDDVGATTNDSLIGIGAGTYRVTVTDNLGCSNGEILNLLEPTVIATITFSSNPSCFEACDGIGEVQPAGGTPPYTYTWLHDVLLTDSVANNLCDTLGTGTPYDGTVFDANSCPLPFQVTITDPPEINISTTSNNPTCFGVCNGDAEVTYSGGLGAPFSVLWSDPGAQSTDAAVNLCDTTYVVAVTDVSGCTVRDTVILTGPSDVVFSGLKTDASCFGICDGEANLNVTGGTTPYASFSWSNGETTEDIINQCAGSYTLTVRDNNTCTFDTTVVIGSPTQITGVVISDSTSCFGGSDGQLTLTASGGDGGPYTYLWDDPLASTGTTVAGLSAGTYNVTITDGLLCTGVVTDSIGQPDSLQAGAGKRDILCFGDCNGIVYSSPSGGTSPYTFLWDDLAATTNDSITSLCAGTFAVEITDANGCIRRDTSVVIEPVQLAASITDTVHVVCACTGEAEVTPTGGTAPYTYLWDDLSGQTSARATGLCAGNYNVLVTDSSGCFVVVPVTINNVSDLDVSITTVNDESCPGNCDGDMTALASGGTGPYDYLWNDPSAQTAATTTSTLCAGVYTVQVTDFNGCVVIATDSIESPNSITGVISYVEPTCNGDNDGQIILVASGGDGGPYTYLWDDVGAQVTPTATGLTAGPYNVQVTDGLGCSNTLPANLTEPDVLLANTDRVDISCFGSCDGVAFASPTGGTIPYTYLWDDVAASTTDSVLNNCPDTLAVLVTDFNGCTSRDTAIVIEPALLSTSIIDTTHVFCTCTGEAEVGATGGTSPYTYLWDDIGAQNSARATGLCAGTYNVIVTDAHGCTSISSVTIVDPSGFDATITDTTHNLCFGECLGEAIVTPTGGALPYSYSWTSSADTDSTSSGICAGSYFATVSDDNGCTRNLPFAITEPTDISVVFNEIASIDCNGNCNGEIEVTASGGTAPYTYLWDDPSAQTGTTASGLCAGTYNVTITDFNGCSSTFSVVLSQPAILTALIGSFNDITCFGANDGQVVATFGGGTAPVSYSWAPGGSVNDTISSLAPNTYIVTVTDFNGCVDTESQVIAEPTLLTSSISDTTHNLCFGECNGFAIVTPVGGTQPYTYLWDDVSAQTDSTATSLCQGAYNVTVSDANSCTSISSVTITEPTDISINLDASTSATCGNCDGTANISASGGIGSLTYLWDANSLGVQSIGVSATDLCAATYTVVVTDDNLCQDSLDVVITGPNALSASINGTTNISCHGLEDGQIDGNVTGGTLPYSYSWDDPLLQNTEDADSLDVGTYTLTVTDGLGCTTFAVASISEPDSLDAGIVSTLPSQCSLPGTGQAVVDQTGGTAPFTYLWTPSLQTTDTATALIASNYLVTVTDANGCEDTAQAVVTGPNALTVSLDTIVDASCVGGGDGSVGVIASGGTGPYTYSWDDPGSQTGATASNLTAGTYTCTVTDDNGCVVQYVGVVDGPAPISISLVSTTNASCLPCDGDATVLATGGTGVLNYLWEANSLGVQSTATLATDLCTSDYWVYVTDGNGCQDSLEIFVPGPADYFINIDSLGSVSCNGDCDGAIHTSITGGTAPYSYQWDDPALQTSDDANSLCTGDFTLTVTDNIGCVATSTINLSQPDILQVSITDSTASGCNLPGTGTATTSVVGGTSPYSYLWDDGFAQTTPVAGGLVAGNYNVQVTDANGCTDSDDVNIIGPNALSLALVSSSNISCFGLCDGAIEVVASGGTAPYSLLWDDLGGSTNASITDLCAGTYTCTLTDDNGCNVVFSIDIIEPSQLTGTFTDTTMVLCNSNCTGVIGFTPTGGTLPYSYSWNSGQTDSLITGLCSGTYDLTYTDGAGCSDNVSMTITEPAQALSTSITALTQISCSANCEGDATVTATGGTLPYTYLWDPNDNGYQQTTAFADTLCAQPYDVLVTDANGCTSVSTATVNNADALSITMSETDITCNGSCDGTADVVIAGGISPYNVLWSNTSTSTSLSGLCPNTYTVTVTDNGGCSLVDSVVITEPDVLSATMTNEQDAICFGDCNGEATVEVTGGTRPYVYSWDNGQTDSTATGLCSRSHDVTVTDANACPSVIVTANINEPISIFILNSILTEPSCNGGSDGSISIIPFGGSGVYPNIDWVPSGATGVNPTGLSQGDHTVTITDDAGCTHTQIFTLGEPTPLFANVTDTTHILCIGVCLGEATVGGSGGTSPYTINWDSGETGAVRSSLCPGNYGFTVVDDNGCIANNTAVINTEEALQAVIDETHVSCNGNCDASMQVIPSGGVAPYTYSWDTGETNDLVSNLCPTSKLVDVTDDNGCIITLSGQVSEPNTLTATITDSTNISCFEACDGTATVTPAGGTAPYSFLWDTNSLGIQQTTYISSYLCAGNFDVLVSDVNGCQTLAEVTLVEPTELLASHSTQAASCNNVSDGAADFSITGGSGGYSFNWSGPDGFQSSTEDITSVENGTYVIQAMDQNGCEVEATVNIPAQIIVNAYAGEDLVVCNGDSVSLVGAGGDVISWSNGVTADSIYVNPQVDTDYVLTVTSSGCIDQDTVNISVNPQPTADAGLDEVIVNGGSTTLQANGGTANATYTWFPETGLSDPTIANPVADPEESITYQLIIQDALGCVDTDYVEVIVVPSVVIPTGITPNGDGRNDTWQLEYITEFPNPVVEIYNRWGQLVFRSQGYLDNWDGTNGEKELPVGTYYYIINLGEGIEPLTGPVTLMR